MYNFRLGAAKAFQMIIDDLQLTIGEVDDGGRWI